MHHCSTRVAAGLGLALLTFATAASAAPGGSKMGKSDLTVFSTTPASPPPTTLSPADAKRLIIDGTPGDWKFVTSATGGLTSGKRLNQVKAAYQETKSEVAELVRESGNDREKHVMTEILAREQTFINSTSPEKIQTVVDELGRLRYQILMRTPSFLKGVFAHLMNRRASMNDQIQASQLIENGKRAIDRDDIENLQQINGRLWDLMPETEKASDEMSAFTGII